MPAPGTGTWRRCRRSGASRWMPESPRRGIGAPHSGCRCDDPPRRSPSECGVSRLFLRRPLQFAEQKFAAVQPGLEPVQRPRRGARHHLAVDREKGSVAGTQKLALALFPVVGAPQMRALRTESRHLVAGVLHYPGGALFADHFPSVHAGSPERHFHRRVRRQAPYIADLDPLVDFFRFGREQQIDQGRQTERGRDGAPQSIDRDYVEIAAAGAFVFAGWDPLHVTHGKTRAVSDMWSKCTENAKNEAYFISGLLIVAGSWP